MDSCGGKPVIVVERGPRYRWALERLGMTYLHETLRNRNRIERWFRELKNRTKRFYNNVNAKTSKSPEELQTAIAAMHNIIRKEGGGNTNLTVPYLFADSIREAFVFDASSNIAATCLV